MRYTMYVLNVRMDREQYQYKKIGTMVTNRTKENIIKLMEETYPSYKGQKGYKVIFHK